MGAYEEGYQAGSVYGAIGACLADTSQQPIYDLGFADAQSGRPMYASYNVTNMPLNVHYDPNPPPTMDVPSQGTNWPPEPPEWPEYHEPGEPYDPEPEPWVPDIMD